MDIHGHDFENIISGAKNASSTKGNPIQLTKEELFSILKISY
jgi:alcohol dehydrogenase class IV